MQWFQCGSAAAHCGKALPFRPTSFLVLLEAEPPAAFCCLSEGKPKAFRYVLRPSRRFLPQHKLKIVLTPAIAAVDDDGLSAEDVLHNRDFRV
jgi:hypothetical protein